MASNQEVGRAGEDAAAAWYEAMGFRVLDRNWRVRGGEIDLICSDGDIVVFCEVKTRSSVRFGRGIEAVGWRKQQRIRALAIQWLQMAERPYLDLRFDVADVDGAGHVDVIEGCF
ncbi:MAG: YraN family protein [Actinomycetia bacterium]|nr:YraN family protein [Actinomycetes bacterium]MCP4227577.1 YraN family protein [Actinomycetes bacterium]MCP5033214.1 YraN family protein [Actinomycetes bacterium]